MFMMILSLLFCKSANGQVRRQLDDSLLESRANREDKGEKQKGKLSLEIQNDPFVSHKLKMSN